jgi:glutamine synthetase
MREFDADPVLQDAMGESICLAFGRAKWAEVEEYRMKVSDWEVERYLEQA